MRGRDDAVQTEQRALSGRLGREHVERRTAQVSRLDRLRERLLVDDAAPGRVHDAGSLLGQLELALADQPLGVGRARQVDRDEVRLDEQRLERRHDVDAELTRPFLGDVRVEGDDPHPERGEPFGHHRAHTPESDDAGGLAEQLHPLVAGALPPPGAERGVGLRHVARLRQKQRDRVLGGRHDVRLRSVHDHDAAPRGLVDVDVVQADAGPGHHLEPLPRCQHLGRHLRLGADDERVVLSDPLGETVGGELGTQVDLEFLAKEFDAAFGELLGDEDAHACPLG